MLAAMFCSCSSDFPGCNFSKECNGLVTLLKWGIGLLKYPSKPNVLCKSVMVLGGGYILDLNDCCNIFWICSITV